MSEKIDINVADEETLTTISGIGPAFAQRIVEYRETVHPFEEVIELAAVPGISEKMVRGFEDLVTVQPVSRGTAVSLDLDEAEETILLAAPEPLEMLEAPETPELLEAPEQPELLAAELPHVEEVAMAEAEPDPIETTPDLVEPEEAIAGDAEEDEYLEEATTLAASDMESLEAAHDVEVEAEMDELNELDVVEEAEELETAVSQPDQPEVEELTLSESTWTEPETVSPQASPPQPPADWEGNAQRRGCITTLLGATFGAILGAVLTLAVLAALNNGSLNYAASDTEIRTQLDTEIISRTNELNQISTRVSLVATQEAQANESLQTDFAEANEAINDELANNEEIISYLATRSGALELRLDEVAGAADTFTGFLDGLRLLLDDLDESPDSATPSPTTRITATPSAEDATSSPTPTPTPLSETTPTPTPTAVQPTRTPQPTATPFTFPTSTPAAQP